MNNLNKNDLDMVDMCLNASQLRERVSSCNREHFPWATESKNTLAQGSSICQLWRILLSQDTLSAISISHKLVTQTCQRTNKWRNGNEYREGRENFDHCWESYLKKLISSSYWLQPPKNVE